MADDLGRSSVYPRDMIGYGRNPPNARWPDGAHIAVQFVVNYEEGGENCILHGDAASEAFLSEIVGAQPWVGQRHMNMESIYEYGARAGFWRLWRLFTEAKIPATVYGVATALMRAPEQVAAMKEANWEIASHGLKWIDYKDYTEEAEREHFQQAMALHAAVTGARPLGWYTGRSSVHSLKLAMEDGGLLYSSDAYADDLPYWVEGPHGPHLVIPYTLDTNDMRFATPQGFNSGDQFFSYLKDSFDVLYEEGRQGAPKMLSIGLHCRLVGRPGRVAALRKFIDYIQDFDGVWCPTRVDIARHWIKEHAPANLKPSTMSSAIFTDRFGDIFEHSPWVAETAQRRGLGAGADTAVGLHARMTSAMRSGTREQKLALIRAHPDLAGRLALAKQLTEDSTREQASVGLDRLTPEELQRFTQLNDSYKHKFGFPFIKAVKGSTKDDILQAFETRLVHEPEREFEAALEEIEKIAMLRLKDRLP